MEKNVGSVNIEELMAARESLDKERGVETDPNIYKDYDPEKHKAEKDNISQSQEESSSIDNNQETSDDIIVDDFDSAKNSNDEIIENDSDVVSQKSKFEQTNDLAEDAFSNKVVEQNKSNPLDLNIYDTFADFEIKENNVEANTTNVVQNESVTTDVEAVSSEISNESDKSNNSDLSLDDFLSELDEILSKEDGDSDEEIVEIDSDTDAINNIDELVDETKNNEDNLNNISDNLDDTIDELKKSVVENEDSLDASEQQNEDNAIDEVSVNDLNNDETNYKFEDIEKDNESVINQSNNETNSLNDSDNNDSQEKHNVEILTDLNKIGEIMEGLKSDELINDSENDESQITAQETSQQIENAKSLVKAEEIEVGGFEKIETFNFIDTISTKEFGDMDNGAYLLGKDSKGKLVCGNLNDTCGTVVFSKNKDDFNNVFNSIILSLILKNTPETMQFVICDPVSNSEFDVYKKSSYMFFNRVAKNNREIVDSVFELSKELENRYNDLVLSGVKNISAFNTQAEERNQKKMPYIMLFINNYSKIMQFLDSEKINTCLYNILKFGRIVGIYVVLSSSKEIEKNEINFNLPTRICFKTEDEYESVEALGSSGAEMLKDDQDFIYLAIYDDEIKHLKTPTISFKEIEIVIENLEN